MFTLVPSEYHSKAPCPGTNYGHLASFRSFRNTTVNNHNFRKSRNFRNFRSFRQASQTKVVGTLSEFS